MIAVHLAEVGARATLCGKRDGRRGPALPYRSVTAPPRAEGVESVCPECARVVLGRGEP